MLQQTVIGKYVVFSNILSSTMASLLVTSNLVSSTILNIRKAYARYKIG